MSNAHSGQLVVFSIEDQVLGIDLLSVERIVWAVEITPMPNAPEKIAGVINVQGSIIPVLNFREILHLPSKPLETTDRFVICKLDGRHGALIVDEIRGIKNYEPQELQEAEEVMSTQNTIKFFLKTDKEIINLLNLDSLAPYIDRELPQA